RRVSAIDIIDSPPPRMLPIPVEEEARQQGQTILRKYIRFVVRNADEISVVRCRNTSVCQLWIKRDQATCYHEPVEDPSGEHGFNAVVKLASGNLVALAIRGPGQITASGIDHASYIVRERPL